MQDKPIKLAVPRFPRHVTSRGERHDLAMKWAQEEATRDAMSLEKQFGRLPSGKDRETLVFGNLMLIKHAWAEERITELETQLAGAMKKIARLSRRLEESNHEE